MPRPRNQAAYFLGRPCIYGHESGLRYKASGNCVECNQARLAVRQEGARVQRLMERGMDQEAFELALKNAAATLKTAGAALESVRSMAPRGEWRKALARHGLTQRIAHMAREFAKGKTSNWLD